MLFYLLKMYLIIFIYIYQVKIKYYNIYIFNIFDIIMKCFQKSKYKEMVKIIIRKSEVMSEGESEEENGSVSETEV